MWNEHTSNDGHDFGHFLIGLVEEFRDAAMAELNYPNTRAAEDRKQECFGLWKGIIRLAEEIKMEWNVCQHIYEYSVKVYTNTQNNIDVMNAEHEYQNTIIDLAAEDDNMNISMVSG
ncbi:MAG: hypothetical protein CMI79_03785 [Candidatus Pelagibacter sp.]|nr:hypothetical protein [Candidatus Pelagibacter sp.]